MIREDGPVTFVPTKEEESPHEGNVGRQIRMLWNWEVQMPNGGAPLHMLIELSDGYSAHCEGTEIEIREGEEPIVRIEGEQSRALATFLRYWFNPALGYQTPPEFPPDADPTSLGLVQVPGVDYWY